jgi:hypothetical protein
MSGITSDVVVLCPARERGFIHDFRELLKYFCIPLPCYLIVLAEYVIQLILAVSLYIYMRLVRCCLVCQLAVDPHDVQLTDSSEHAKDTVEFDRVERMITLRQYTRPVLSCGDTLIREQRLPMDSIDSFKCAQSSKIVRPHIFGDGVDRHHAILLAVKRSLRHDDLDDWLVQAGHATPSYCPMLGQSSPVQSSTAGPPYAWPAFIERSIFAHGDLLFLNFHRHPYNFVPLPDSQYRTHVYADRNGYVCEEHSHVQDIVQQLNFRLAQARGE